VYCKRVAPAGWSRLHCMPCSVGAVGTGTRWHHLPVCLFLRMASPPGGMGLGESMLAGSYAVYCSGKELPVPVPR
jgi:hypothetical protein